LLKILDPLPDEVLGDLYFEMHEVKQEVYVVTHVDQQAWPGGEGGIRFGFNQALRKSFASDEVFKQAYLQAVKNYQHVRIQIDSLLDKKLSLPVDLVNQEKVLRQKMEVFIAIKKIRLGDVITVPCFTPHSLQHGVRTVEFQTPVYERKILSFAQKVLTQNHWDTEEALQKIALDAPRESPLKVLEKTATVYRERVVQFDDFKVERITLANNAQLAFAGGSYRLLLVVSGDINVAKLPLEAAQAKLLPAHAEITISCLSKTAVFLMAEPL
jgi:mannose-6-phosphate isomerase class I